MDKESIFAEALEKDSPEDRARFLDEVCAGDPKLRAEIEHLLAAHDDAGSFLNRPPDELELTADSAGNTSRDEAGDAWRELLEPSDNPDCLGMLGPYEVMERVGRGGMGVVLRARDAKLNRTVAIKLLAPELSANAMAVRRFLREAQAAAAVSHDHVVTIHAIDEEARPPIIVMEYVDGQSLQQKIDAAGALDVTSILRIGLQTAAGLAAAHRQGLVHRDVKPSNILLENGIERVKLTDFGLARAVDDIGMTRTGQITGTPQYMSPEQAQGQPIDHRTDLFSLGCVLYAMCTGRAAFRADSAVAVMHRVVHDAPRPIRELNADMPVWLSEIVDRLMEKNPDDRFESAEEVENLLGRHLVHLQQPDSEPRPEHVWPVPARSAELDEKTVKGLTFVRNVLAFFGVLSVIWFLGCLAMPNHGYSGFGFTMPTLLLSLLSGGLAINGAWHVAHRQSFGWTLVGSIALLFPINFPQMFGLFFTVWASAILWRQEIQDAFESQSNARRYYVTRHSSGTTTPSWFRRIPIPTWIALLLFLVVFACAVSEWAGISHELGARPNGILFYLLGTGFVMVWGLCIIATRLIRGPRPRASLLPPRGSQIAGFFTALILLTGVFVWQWTDLSNPMERERMLGFFVRHGSITLRLKNPDTKVEFNGTAIEVPADGVVVIRPDKPGGFILARHHANGWVGHSESLIYGGMNADFTILEEATRVIVTGPIRGEIEDEATKSNEDQGDEHTPSSGSVESSANAAQSTIQRALQAHGGAENVAKWRSARIKIKGTVSLPTGQSLPMTVEDIGSYPGRFRTTREIDRGGATASEIMVLNGDQGWLHVEGRTQPIPALSEMQEQLYCQSLDKLFPFLQQDNDRQVNSLPEAVVNGAVAVGIVVSAKGHRDVKLYFEKSTGLLIKREHTVLNNTGNTVIHESVYRDYKEVDGLMHWTKFSASEDGRKTVAGELVNITFEDELDANIFSRP